MSSIRAMPPRRRASLTSPTRQPGIRRKKSGKGFTYTKPDGAKVDGQGDARAHQVARHPAGLHGCVDLREGQRPYPGDRPRRQGPQAVPLPSGLPRGSREHEIRAHARIRPRPAGDPQDHRRAYEPARPAAREGAGDGGASAREHPDPRRQCRLRQAEQELRPHHPARSACEGGGRRAALPVQGQERQDLEACR